MKNANRADWSDLLQLSQTPLRRFCFVTRSGRWMLGLHGLLTLVLCLGPNLLIAASPGPQVLRCEYLANPLGIDTLQPRLSWLVGGEGRGVIQTAYQVLVATSEKKLSADVGDLWDSGKVSTQRSIQVPYGGAAALSSGERCWWKVRVWRKSATAVSEARSEWSEIQWWEMGLLNPADWRAGDQPAQWIATDGGPGEARANAKEERAGQPEFLPAPLLRKTFQLEGTIAQARAYVCGLGFHELHVNGQKVGDHVLDPAVTDYDKRAFYVTYDITAALQQGTNAVGILVGDGWYDQYELGEGKLSYGKPGATAVIRIILSDGRTVTLVTDESWKAVPSPILFNQVYVGEVYDARKELPGWNTAGFDDSGFPDAVVLTALSPELQAQQVEPIKVTQSLDPIERTNPAPGIWVYNLGQNIAGWAEIRLKATSGTRVQLKFAEAVNPDGTVNTASTGDFLIGQPQHDVYISKGGGIETWKPRFVYHGFQYVEVSGLPENEPPLSVRGEAVHTALEPVGHFNCSEPMLNRIYESAKWTLRGNLHGVLTDCPHRERGGWTGDAQIAAETLILNYGAGAFWTKYIRDIETSLSKGLPTAIAPGKRNKRIANPDWGAAVILLPWYLYRYYDDVEILREQYPHMKRFLEYMGSLSEGLIVSAGYGDWYDPPTEGPEAPSIPMPKHTPVAVTSTAYYAHVADIMARTAAVLGNQADSKAFKELAERVQSAFNAHFLDRQKNTYGSQTAAAMALNFGLVPDELRSAVVQSLLEDIRSHNGHFSTGIHGAKVLYEELSKAGQGHVAQSIFMNKDYPSIGYLFSLGATTMWENWSLTNNHRNHPRSHNHPMNTGFATWFARSLGGIRLDPEVPGYRHFYLEPDIRNSLEFAEASYRSPYGWIRSHWQVKEGVFEWRIEVPANSTARIRVPHVVSTGVTESDRKVEDVAELKLVASDDESASFEMGSGIYRFCSRISREEPAAKIQ